MKHKFRGWSDKQADLHSQGQLAQHHRPLQPKVTSPSLLMHRSPKLLAILAHSWAILGYSSPLFRAAWLSRYVQLVASSRFLRPWSGKSSNHHKAPPMLLGFPATFYLDPSSTQQTCSEGHCVAYCWAYWALFKGFGPLPYAGKPVAYNNRLNNSGLLCGIVACYFGLLGLPERTCNVK